MWVRCLAVIPRLKTVNKFSVLISCPRIERALKRALGPRVLSFYAEVAPACRQAGNWHTRHVQYLKIFAEVAELAYAQVSEACAERLEGSNPSFRTNFS